MHVLVPTSAIVIDELVKAVEACWDSDAVVPCAEMKCTSPPLRTRASGGE